MVFACRRVSATCSAYASLTTRVRPSQAQCPLGRGQHGSDSGKSPHFTRCGGALFATARLCRAACITDVVVPEILFATHCASDASRAPFFLLRHQSFGPVSRCSALEVGVVSRWDLRTIRVTLAAVVCNEKQSGSVKSCAVYVRGHTQMVCEHLHVHI